MSVADPNPIPEPSAEPTLVESESEPESVPESEVVMEAESVVSAGPVVEAEPPPLVVQPEPVGVEPESGTEPVAVEPESVPEPVAVEPEPALSGDKPETDAAVERAPESELEAAVVPKPKKRPAPVPVAEIATIVTGVVTEVNSKEVELALRDRRTAVIYRRAIDENQSDPTTVFSVGDTAEGIELTREDPKSRVVLSRVWAIKSKKWKVITEAKESGTQLEGEVTGISGKGLVVDVGVRGFVPASHLELEPVEDLSPYVGRTLSLKVIDVDVGRERVVLSRRSVLMKAARKSTHDAMAALEVGSVVSGTVASIASYGAFVDVGGVNGLVHLSECSWARVRSAKEVVKVGDVVDVKILDVKIKKKRISLSIRQVAADPLADIEVGGIREGTVARLVDFGAFVDIGGTQGLVHLSELAEHRVFSASEIVFPGETVRVKVLSVDKKRRRVELSIRQAVYG